MLFPDTKWHPWMERRIERLCDDDYAIKVGNTTHRYVTWFGCAASGKTHDAAFYGFLWWCCWPSASIVIHTSTTFKTVRQRVWPVVQDLYHRCPIPPGNLVDSKTTLQARKGDDKHGMFAKAVKGGNTQTAMAEIQGLHAPRMLVVVDEATEVPEAIVHVCENLKKGCQDFTLLMIGNPTNWMNPLGMAGEPKGGIDSITVDDPEWLTKRGVCLHFDGYRSPNVLARKTIYPFIYTYEDYLINRESRKEDTIEAWQFDRGFPAPEAVSNTILSGAAIRQHDAKGKFTFYQSVIHLASLDPAFGGDRCVLRFGRLGDLDSSGKMGLQLDEVIEIQPLAVSTDPVDVQIAKAVIAECAVRGVKPENFAADATGTGRGVYAIICEKWSMDCLRVEFGGAPSEKPASDDDTRPACEIYDRRVSELAFSIRAMTYAGQLKGLTDQDEWELTRRTYEYRGKKVSIQKKDDFKEIHGKSPDYSDALSVMIELVRQKNFTTSSRVKARSSTQWLAKAREYGRFLADSDDDEPEPATLFEA